MGDARGGAALPGLLKKAADAQIHATLTLRPPESEAKYDALVAFADELTSRYNCNEGPQAALFDLVAVSISRWKEASTVPTFGALWAYVTGQVEAVLSNAETVAVSL